MDRLLQHLAVAARLVGYHARRRTAPMERLSAIAPRTVIVVLCAVVVASSALPSATFAAAPEPTTDPDVNKDRTDPNGGRVVERPAVNLGFASSGGAQAAAVVGPPGDASIRLRGKQPGEPINARDLWTERSRTTANGEGRYTLESAAGRLNYKDATGQWQPIDLTLVPATDVTGYGVRTTANDRDVRFGQTSADDSLARLSTTKGTLSLRALDYPSKLVEHTPEPALSPTPAAPPSPGPISEPPAPSPVATSSNDAAPSPEPSSSPANGDIPALASAASTASGSALVPAASAIPSAAAPAASATPSTEASAEPPASSSPSAAPAVPVDDPAVVRFRKDGLTGDLVVRATDEGFEFGAILDRPDQANVYAFAVDVGALDATLDKASQTILLAQTTRSEGGSEQTLVGVVGAPVMLDANEVPAPPATVSVALYDPTKDVLPPAGLSADALAGMRPGEIALIYTIDPVWLATPDRAFPVKLDPDACLGEGASGCTINGTGTNFDHFIASGIGSQYPIGWTVFRVGYDVRADDGDVYGTMRGMVYFQDVSLPDGAVLWDSNLRLHISSEYGGPAGETITAYRIKKGWGQTTSWTGWGSGTYDSGGPLWTSTVPSSGNMNFDVDGIVQSWYTRRAKDWKPDIGFLVRMDNEGSTHGEVEFDRYNDATAAYRPLLTLSYELPEVSIDFDAALGANYAPSTMVAGLATSLPVRVTNNDVSLDFVTANWLVGYRWFDAKGKLVSSGQQALPQCVGDAAGCVNPSPSFGLNVTPPATVGQYTLRLDLVRNGSVDQYSSDWATPSKFYSRNKKTLSGDDTRWVGSSVIERDEFSVAVIAGGGGDGQAIDTGDGGALGIDLWSKNLSYTGGGGVAIDDLETLELGYGYDSKQAADCGGILDACGWATTWDERLISSPTAGTFTYVDDAGTRHLVGVDGDAQLTSGAPVLLQRQRATFADEAVPSNTPTASLVVPPSPGPWSGQYAVKVAASTATVSLGTIDTTSLNANRYARFALKASAAASSGLGFKIRNNTTGTEKWLVYTVGTSWTSPETQIYIGGVINGSTWAYYSRDLYTDVRSNSAFGDWTDDYDVTAVSVYNKSGSTGDIYVDGLRLESGQTDIIEDANPTWSSGGTLTSVATGDVAAGTSAVRINKASISASPDCNQTLPSGNPCWPTTAGGLWSYGFVHWRWKKVGGQTAAIVFHVRDERTSTSGDITYYAGPTPPAGAINPLQVSDVTPVGWALVRRNLLEDARQVLNFYNDNPAGSSPSAPPTQGPTPDDTKMTGFKIVAFDGIFLLIDDLDYGGASDQGEDEATHPSVVGDTTYTYDFTATYADGTVHYFNALGLLDRIADRDGNSVDFDWSVPDLTVAGAAGYRLDKIHAPSDGSSSAFGTYDRELQFAYAGSSPRTITVSERLGTTASPISGRSTVFTVATAAGTGYTTGDLLSVKPARAVTCAASGTPSGCDLFSYSATYAHMLAFAGDPRWDQTSTTAPADYRFEVTWAGTAPNQYPTTIVDRSAGAGGGSGTPLLRVLNYAVGSALPAAARVAWQDGAGISKNFARYTDLTSDGRTLSESIPLVCGAADCATLPSTANLANQRATESQFDGLARESTSITYRCPGVAVSGCTGTTAQKIVSRQGTKAGAKVDNFIDPLTAGQLGWSQTPDQYVASLRDSAGSNQDLYRTFYTYDQNGQQASVARPAYNARPDYLSAIKSTAQLPWTLKGYWRLEETSGFAVDQSGNGGNGTYTNFAAGYGSTPGALIGAPGAAPSFDGVDDYIIMSSFGNVSGSYTVEAWFRPADTTTTPMTIAGSRSGADKTFDLKVNANSGRPLLYADVGSGSAWLATAISAPIPDYVANRWYHAALSVDDAADLATLYLDGRPVATATVSGTPMLTDATRILRAGQNGLSSTPERFKGGIDEIAVYTQALTPAQVAGHVQAGRSVAVDTIATLRDTRWRAIQADDQFLASPGFESGLVDWDFGAGSGGTIYTAASNPAADPLLHQPSDATLPPSWSSFKTGTSGNAQQDVQLVPGQTVRFQVWHKLVGAAGWARINLYYWKRSAGGSWQTLVNASYSDTTWTGRAWDVTLPFDSDGRVRIALWVNGVTGSDSVYFDDAALLTTYGRTNYTSIAGGDPFEGLVRNTITFSPTQSGPIGEFLARTGYAASAAAPAIYPTTTTANYVDGTFSPATPDVDVSTTKTFDAWGNELTTTDQDGVTTTTAYVGSGLAGYATDVASSTNGLGEQTTFEYDPVGNRTKVTAPGNLVTTTTYDQRSHPLLVTDPLSLVSKDVYDAYGFRTSSIANRIDDTPSGPSGLDDLTTSYAYDEFGLVTTTTANTGVTGAIGARTATTHDVRGSVVSSSPYATYDGTAFGAPRTMTKAFEVVLGAVRPNPSAARGPGSFAATSSSPACPDGSGLYCNAVDTLDQDGQAVSSADAYNVVTRTFRDLAGQPAFSIANYADGVYLSSAPDVDVVSEAQRDLFGRTAVAKDTLGHRTETTFDALGRATQIRTYDDQGVAVSDTRTRYTGAGRVDRVSRPGDSGVADAALIWTKTVYDKAGRAIKTLDHYDIAGAAALSIDALETPITDITINNDDTAEAWSATAGTFVAAGATATREGAASTAHSGAGRLALTTGTGANTGAEWSLDGTFTSGHTYQARLWVNAPSGTTVDARIGVAADPSPAVSVAGNGAWQALDLSWPTTADRTSVKLAVYRAAGAAAVTFYVDDVVVWDTATGRTDWNIPTETAYDVSGRIVASVVAPGTVGTAEAPLVTRTAYDALGRVTAVTVNEIAGAGATPVANLLTATTYDALGRVSSTTDPLATVTQFAYDRLGRLTSTTDNYLDGTAGSATSDDDVASRFAYDALGELTGYCSGKQVFVAGCDETSPTNVQVWHYAYDDAGHLLSQTPPVNLTATALVTSRSEYDTGGRLVKSCDGPSTITTCGSAGVLRTVASATAGDYDAVGRLKRSTTYSGPMTTIASRIDTTYRGDGQPTQTVYSTGPTPSVVDTIDYAYDAAGRQTKVLRGATVLAERSFNKDGTTAWRKDGDNAAIGQSSFYYDWAKRLTSVDLPDATFSTAVPTFSWRLDGLIAGRTWSGTSATFAYDAAKRPTSISKGALSETQTYDRDGNVTSEGRSFSGVTGDPGTGTQSFSYDALGRVTGSSGLASGTRSYTYDRDGNRLTKTEGGATFTYTYDRTDELLTVLKTGGSTQNFAYDAYGNQTSDAQTGLGVTAMTYDLDDHLTGIDATGTSNDATFSIDALGRFKTRAINGVTDTYSYLDTSETVARIATAGTNTDSVVSPSGDRLGVRVGSTVNWFLPDLHGSVAASLDAAETTVVNAIRYDAWGQTLLTGTGGGTRVGDKAWKYQGRLDVSPDNLQTPLYDMSARFYNPGLGAFTQLDSDMGSAQDPLSMNRFLYAAANPATLIDPSGHYYVEGEDGPRIYRYTPRSSSASRDRGRHHTRYRYAPRGESYNRRYHEQAVHRTPLYGSVDVVSGGRTRAGVIRDNYQAGKAHELRVLDRVTRSVDLSEKEIRHDQTIKDPRTGRSVDRYRSDIQVWDRKSATLDEIYEAKSSVSSQRLDAMEREAIAKYEASAAKLPGHPKVPVRVVGELRPRPVNLTNAGRAAGAAFTLFTIVDVFIHGVPSLKDILGNYYWERIGCPPPPQECVG